MKLYTFLFWLTAALMIAWPRYWLFATPLGTAASPFSIADILAMALLFTLLLQRQYASRFFQAFDSHRLLFLVYFAWVATRLLSDVLGLTPSDSLGSTFRSIVYRESILFLGLIIASRRSFGTLVSILLLICVIEGALAIYQQATEQTLASMMNIDFSAQTAAAAASAVRLTLAIYREGQFRVAGSFSHPIALAQFMAAMLPVAIHAIRTRPGSPRVIGLAAMPLIVFTIYASVSRSGFVAAIISVAAYAIMLSFGRRLSIGKVAVSLALSGLAVLILSTVLRDVIDALLVGKSAGEQGSSLARDNMVSTGMYALSLSPYLGFGDGNGLGIAGTRGANDVLTVDNYYLSTVLDFGLLGLAVNLMLFSSIVLTFLKSFNTLPQARDRDFCLAVAAATISILIGQYVISTPDNLSVLYLFATVAIGSSEAFRRPDPAHASTRPRYGAASAVVPLGHRG